MSCRPLRVVLLAAAVGLLLTAGDATPQPARLPPPVPKPKPRLEAVADTKLLMEALAEANFRSVRKNLTGDGPKDVAEWAFARGQALVLAETGNLMMMRPPRSGGQDLWMDRAAELRNTATRLAQHAAARDLNRCRLALSDLASACTRCHQAFRVPIRVNAHAPAE